MLNKNKDPSRKNKILFIYAAKDYEKLPKRDKLRSKDIAKIVSAFKNYKGIEKYCQVSSFDELKENEFNLNVPRYVDISEPEEEVDIQATIDDIKELEKEREDIEIQVKSNLKELGFKT